MVENRLTRRNAIKVGAVAGLATFQSGCLGSEGDETESLQLAGVAPEAWSPPGFAMGKFAELVNQKTEGRVEIDVSFGGEWGSQEEINQGPSVGTLDIAAGSLEFIYTDAAAMKFPYLFDSIEETIEEIGSPRSSDFVQSTNEAVIEEHGVRVLGNIAMERHLWTNELEVYSPGDLEGEDIRSPPAEYWEALIRGLGGNPTAVDFAEVSTALATGTVSGFEIDQAMVDLVGLFDVIDYSIMTGHIHNLMNFYINEDVYQNLDDEGQEALLDAGEEIGPLAVEEANSAYEAARESMEEESQVIDQDQLDMNAFRENCADEMLDAFPNWENLIKDAGLSVPGR